MAWPWTVTFEVAFDTDPADEPGVWTDLSDRVRHPVNCGQARAGNARPATLSLKNRDRALDPTNGAAIYNLVPMRHARLTVTVGATTYPLFRGYVEDWPPYWPEFNQAVIAVRLTDALAWVAQQDMDVDLPAQTTGARINALLDLAGWPAGRRDIATGLITLEPYEQHGANLLRVLIDTADAEDGMLYVDPLGDVVFYDRHFTLDATPTLSFGPSNLKVSAVTPRFGASGIVNVGRVELADGDVYEIIDDASVDDYGPGHPWTTRDLSLPPAEAEGLAQWAVVRWAEPRLTLEGLATNGHATGALPSLLGARMGDVADFTHTPPGGGTVEMTGVTESIDHTIAKGEWISQFALDSYHGDGPWLTLDDPVLGLLDEDNVFAP